MDEHGEDQTHIDEERWNRLPGHVEGQRNDEDCDDRQGRSGHDEVGPRHENGRDEPPQEGSTDGLAALEVPGDPRADAGGEDGEQRQEERTDGHGGELEIDHPAAFCDGEARRKDQFEKKQNESHRQGRDPDADPGDAAIG